MNRTLATVKKTEAEKEKGALGKYLSKSIDLFETEKSDKQVESDDSETNISKEITSEAKSREENSNPALCDILKIKDDPATWPNKINQNVRDYLVNEGPPKITVENFPQKEKGLNFSKFHCQRKLKNGEVIERPWLIYSESFGKVYYYYCKLFDTNSDSALATSRFDSWSNIYTILEDHEKSKKQETKRWNQVFERLVASVQFLAERNLAFRGSEEQIGNLHNGNFLGVIELLGKFDPVMQDHIQKIINKDIHDHHLGKTIQDEIIDTIGQAVLQEIIARIKSPSGTDVNGVKSDGTHSDVPAGIYEHFIKFIIVESSTGENLFNTRVKEIEMLGLDVENIRGQGYDNGANMKGHNFGVQERLLKRNSRALYTPCVCHNYNLVLGDMAKTCSDVMTFFETLQRIYTLFALSTKRWTVFKKHVKGLSVKQLPETRWECRMESVKAVRFQPAEVCDALEELAKSTNAQGKSEAESLVSQMTNYRFLVALCYWHSLLFEVNFTSKELQSNTIDIAAGLTSFEKLFDWLKTYRETGFVAALMPKSLQMS
ncbi:zinc finger MYM-type protein 1-like [Hydra vulgaris]|uniref:zinc finger MYM-type protein 1-like n=1 Tax=Hydra vulgaris TaxID=6087 RepID=UPI001F5E4FD0|nr:zinc finger MYM-type protein 1-like [Hydra vulgaris]